MFIAQGSIYVRSNIYIERSLRYFQQFHVITMMILILFLIVIVVVVVAIMRKAIKESNVVYR